MADGNRSQDKASFFKEWLEKLQQESWQLELLISGFALFGIYESRSLVYDYDLFVAQNIEGSPKIVFELFGVLINVGWRIFFINLLLHVMLRGLWIGAIGLRYVSGEIDFDKLDYTPFFTQYLKRKIGSYDDFIEKLEKGCSVIFAYTFLLFLFFVSSILFLAVFSLLNLIIVELFDLDVFQTGLLFAYFGIPYFGLGGVVFFDLLTLGGLKRALTGRLSKVYFYIYWFFSAITFSFLYRPLLYNFLDEKYTRRLFYLSIPYILIISFGGKIVGTNLFPHFNENNSILQTGRLIDDKHYLDKLDSSIKYLTPNQLKEIKVRPPIVELEAFTVDGNYTSFFTRMSSSDYELLTTKDNIEPIMKEGVSFKIYSDSEYPDKYLKKINEDYDEQAKAIAKSNTSLRREYRKASKSQSSERSVFDAKIDSLFQSLKILRQNRDSLITSYQNNKEESIKKALIKYIDVKIDDIPYKDSLQCYYYTHPFYQRKGLKCYLPTRSLSEGVHHLYFAKQEYNELKKDSIRQTERLLPFLIDRGQ